MNGNGTYDIIMKNIMDVKEVLPMSLRINVDYDNIAEANKVMNFLREKDDVEICKSISWFSRTVQ